MYIVKPRLPYLAALITVIFCLCASASGPGECMKAINGVSEEQSQFQPIVVAFLAAVKNRDFEAFKKYFNEQLAFKAILPGGKTFDSVPAFMASQMEWFNGTTGKFEFALERTEVSKDLGTAFAKADYENVDAHGKPFRLEIYFTFIFQRVNGQWFLVHDQNTVLRDIR